jgi:hypothetical protein
MSTATLELVRLCEALPEAKQTEVTDFARFLLEREGQDRWEAVEAEAEPRPKFEAFLREAATEKAEPLDLSRL